MEATEVERCKGKAKQSTGIVQYREAGVWKRWVLLCKGKVRSGWGEVMLRRVM